MSRKRRWLAGGLAGFLAAAAGLAVSEAVTALLPGVTSPLLSVGDRAIDATPRQLKELAIESLGTRDKPVLVTGIVVTVAVVSFVAGAVGTRRPKVAIGFFAGLSLVAATASVTDRSATGPVVFRLLPVIALAVVAVGALLMLLRTLRVGHAPTGGEGSAAFDEVPASFDRRGFLVAAAVVGAAATAGGVARQVLGGSAAGSERADVRLPRPAQPAPALPRGSSLDVRGITPQVTSNSDFYRVDTALSVPDVPIDGYTLRIHGMVDKEVQLTFADLLDRRLVERRITLTCVSNQVGGPYVGNAAWLGVPVRDLLEEAGVHGGADAVKSTSADNFTVGTPLQALTDPHRHALIAVGMNGEPLPLKHGFPVRMVVPGLYGFVSATKWLVDLEVTRFADFEAYWSSRGYSAVAPIKTSSRIDVPRSFARVKAGSTVTVAGVAWSQNRGIRRVEVRVDGGPWHHAELAELDNIDTWRQWRWPWPATSGSHTIEVRATDATGYTQTERRAPIAPDGSTGWHSVNVTAV